MRRSHRLVCISFSYGIVLQRYPNYVNPLVSVFVFPIKVREKQYFMLTITSVKRNNFFKYFISHFFQTEQLLIGEQRLTTVGRRMLQTFRQLLAVFVRRKRFGRWRKPDAKWRKVFSLAGRIDGDRPRVQTAGIGQQTVLGNLDEHNFKILFLCYQISKKKFLEF